MLDEITPSITEDGGNLVITNVVKGTEILLAQYQNGRMTSLETVTVDRSEAEYILKCPEGEIGAMLEVFVIDTKETHLCLPFVKTYMDV